MINLTLTVQKLTLGIPENVTPLKYAHTSDFICIEQTHFDEKDIIFQVTERGCRIELPMSREEEVFGFGLQLKNTRHRGQSRSMRVNADPVGPNGESHAPVPFFVSTKGYGVYVDTARYATFTCGAMPKRTRSDPANNSIITNAKQLYEKSGIDADCVMLIDVPCARGVDLYIFEGENITDVVCAYNMFSGGGCEVPMWGLGVFYRCYTKYCDEDVLKKARQLRQQSIPCTILGLEPGWHSNSYPCSFDWDQERFPNHDDMLKELAGMDYHVNLWEHAFTASCSPIYYDLLPHSGDFEVWHGIVPDFADEKARRIFADYHRKALIEKGIDGFKLDECDSSDYTGGWSFPNCSLFPSGLDGEQMHALFGVLYQQTMLSALDGRKTLSEVRSSGALAAPYPFVLYSDLYDHRDFIRGLASAGLSGLLWTPEVRGVRSKDELIRRIQTAVFSPQCLINAWSIPESPWVEYGAEREVRQLFNLRMALLPYLFTAFDLYHRTGRAPVRPLVSDYTGDPETYGIDDEYLFGDDMLVAPIFAPEKGRSFYLPEGQWYLWNTDTLYESGWHSIETDEIPVFVKMGSVIPLAEPVTTVREDTLFRLTLHSYGSGKDFVLADEEHLYHLNLDTALSLNSSQYAVTGIIHHGFEK